MHIHTPFCNELNVTFTECTQRHGDVAEAQEDTDDVALVNNIMTSAVYTSTSISSRYECTTTAISVPLIEYARGRKTFSIILIVLEASVRHRCTTVPESRGRQPIAYIVHGFIEEEGEHMMATGLLLESSYRAHSF